MKPAEKILLICCIVIIASLLATRFYFLPKQKFKRWQQCAGDVELTCQAAANKADGSVATVQCLADNYKDLSKACQTMVRKKYGRFLKRNKRAAGGSGDAPKAEAGAFDVASFLAPCKPFWSAECKQQDDKSGANVQCFAGQSNFPKFSKECKNVMLEIIQWAPKECVNSPVLEPCKGSYGIRRLECFARNQKKLPAECAGWSKAVKRIIDAR